MLTSPANSSSVNKSPRLPSRSAAMTEVEFQAGDELDGDLQNEGDAGTADENADATAVSMEHNLIDEMLDLGSIRCLSVSKVQ